MLVVQHISKLIQHKAILSDCSLQVRAGAFTAVVGANGAGKSTLFKLMSGEMPFSAGEISVNGKPLKAYSERALSQIRAVLPQHTFVNFPFTVGQVIEIGRYAHNSTQQKNEQIIGEVLQATQLTAFRQRAYQSLSGGEQQRVQMGRVMAQIWQPTEHPKYLLLDEPTSSLDVAQQHALLGLAKQLTQRGIGVLAILHDLNLALQYADEILFLKKGKTVAYGAADSVATKEVIEETFSHPVRILHDGGQKIIVPQAVVRTKTTPENFPNLQYA